MHQCAPGILAACNRRDLSAIEADQLDRRRSGVGARPEPYLRAAIIDGEYQRHLLALALRRIEDVLDLGTARTDRLPFAVDDDLRGVDGAQAQEVGIMLLAPRRRGTGERVLPAEPIP